MEKSAVSKQKVGIGDTSITKMNNLIQSVTKRNDTCMQESHHTNKSMTLKDKLLSYKKPIQTMKLSKTLDQELISNAQGSSRFWKNAFKEEYKKLWLPTRTDFLDLDLISSNSSLQKAEFFSQCLTMKTPKNLLQNWQETSLQSLQYSLPDTMVPESIVYTRKIRIYPNPEQLKLFTKCLGATRYFYNQTVSYINRKSKKNGNLRGLLNFKRIRRIISQPDSEISDDHKMAWQKEVPYDTRDQAVKDACQAFKTALALKRAGLVTHFKVKYRSKKASTTSFKVNPNALNNNMCIFTTRLKKKSHIRVKRRHFREFYNEGNIVSGFFSISRTKSGKWYICLPREKGVPKQEEAVFNSVYLDPGVRTFQTIYSPDGVCGKIGEGFSNSLEVLSKTHSTIQGLCAKDICRAEKRYRLRKKCAEIRERISNKVNNLHWQTCSFLCKNFQNIFIPDFQVSNMVNGSPLGSDITRKMLGLSHYAFRQKLIWYSKTKSRNVFVIKEHYTSKTCGSCGCEQEIGGDKEFNCHTCHVSLDRDYNGARNICLSVFSALKCMEQEDS